MSVPPTDDSIAKSPGISYQELLDTDTREVPEVLRLQSPKFLGNDDFSKERYTSRQWHEREVVQFCSYLSWSFS